MRRKTLLALPLVGLAVFFYGNWLTHLDTTFVAFGQTAAGSTGTCVTIAPTLSGLTPSSASAGSGDILLTAIGNGFSACDEITVNGTAFQTTFLGTNQLQTTLPASLLSAPQTLSITVSNRVGAITNSSAAASFTVLPGSTASSNPVPALIQISPTSVRAGSADVTLAVSGSGFLQSSLVTVNGSTVTTAFSSSSALSAVLPASLLANPQTLSVTVVNPAPGGGTSGPLSFGVLPALPVFNSMIPSSGAPGTSFVARIIGNNLSGLSQVAIGGAGITATVLSGGTSGAAFVTISVSGTAPVGPRNVSLTTPGGTATSSVPGFTVQRAIVRQEPTQPQPIAAVEQGNTQTGYIVITADGNSTLPSSTLTLGIVQNGTVLSQTTVLPGNLTTLASVGLDEAPDISRSFGLALVNAAAQSNTISLTVLDSGGTPVTDSVNVVLGAHRQVSKFLSEIFPAGALGPALTGSLIMQATNPFSSIGLRFSGVNFSTVGSANTIVSPAPLDAQLTGCSSTCSSAIFPQFAIGGGWASQLMLVETSGVATSGHVAIFDANGQPLTVTLNGQTSASFSYSLPPGGTFILAPRDSNGLTPF